MDYTQELLQTFLSIPAPAYHELREVSTELEEVTEERDALKDEVETLKDEAKDLSQEIDYKLARINELTTALADALAWIADDKGMLPNEFANNDAEFLRLYSIV